MVKSSKTIRKGKKKSGLESSLTRSNAVMWKRTKQCAPNYNHYTTLMLQGDWILLHAFYTWLLWDTYMQGDQVPSTYARPQSHHGDLSTRAQWKSTLTPPNSWSGDIRLSAQFTPIRYWWLRSQAIHFQFGAACYACFGYYYQSSEKRIRSPAFPCVLIRRS